MKLFIRIKNGKPFEHPILEENFKQVFPEVDVNNLPDWAARFERIEYPKVGTYEVYDGVSYEWDGSVVKDVHHIRTLTAEEKQEKQTAVKEMWLLNNGFVSWIFNEDLCVFVAPIPYPNDGKNYNWNEEHLTWVEM